MEGGGRGVAEERVLYGFMCDPRRSGRYTDACVARGGAIVRQIHLGFVADACVIWIHVGPADERELYGFMWAPRRDGAEATR